MSKRERDQVASSRSRPSGVEVPGGCSMNCLIRESIQGAYDAEDAVGGEELITLDEDVGDQGALPRGGDHEVQVRGAICLVHEERHHQPHDMEVHRSFDAPPTGSRQACSRMLDIAVTPCYSQAHAARG
jgi:hypothetical protein